MSREFHHRLSVALNVVLVATAVALALHKTKPNAAASAIEPEPVAETPVIQNTKLPQYMDAASALDKRRWLVDQLRAMGVPNNILARVVQEDLYAGWSKHAAKVAMECFGDAETMAALQLDVDMSRDAEMRAALGEQSFRQWDCGNMLREANSGKIQLTAAETGATYDLWKKLQQRELELKQAKLKGEMDDADASDAYEKAVSEFKEQMKGVLGEQRYAESQQVDDGSAAAALRRDFVKANPSDSQFQELLKTQQQWNERRAQLDKLSEDDQSSATYAEQIKALDAARDQEYRRVLGTNAFEAIQKEQDPSYSRMRKYENIWGLDDNKIDYVYGTLKYYQKSVEDYQDRARELENGGRSVDWEGVKKNLQQFAEQTGLALQTYLGRDSFNRMEQNGIFQFDPPELTEHRNPTQ